MFVCDITGLLSVVGPCDPGYYCPEGSRRIDQELCPMGYYCPLATHYPEQCMNGTFSNTTGLSAQSQCRLCTSGFYCNGYGLVDPNGPCDPGQYFTQDNFGWENIPCYILFVTL